MNAITKLLNHLFHRPRAPRSKVLQGIKLAQEHGIPKHRVQAIMTYAIQNHRDSYPEVFYNAIYEELVEPYIDH